MKNTYIEYNFKVSPLVPGVEILMAELSYLNFDSFEEVEDGLMAYILKEEWKENMLEEVQILQNPEFEITWVQKEFKQINWNEEWEKNFSPILIDDVCYVRAPFHAEKDVAYDIIIEPKMSFGTGHHETTYMMLEYVLTADLQDKAVLDMGCGTSVLAILASKRGAQKADAVDFDSWCYENSLENIEKNNCKNIQVYEGAVEILDTLSSEDNPKYEVILANINRNVLLEDIPSYLKHLKKGGELYVSGFYKEDLPLIQEKASLAQATFVDNKERNNWIAARFKK